ncbi:HDOD domain-containing protein [Steroidobacter denitrificans]|uniref:HDOD domain-containing protein n=1 Tax=Steroidobacter denitrificans TaxID=465721 RepID=UPI000830EDFF|nr:HDOD domain-containing protein [Steroidobacter denitrificans]
MIASLAGLGTLAVVSWSVFFLRHRRPEDPGTAAAVKRGASATEQAARNEMSTADNELRFSTTATDVLLARCDELAFGLAPADKPFSAHEAVLERIGQGLAAAIHQRDYFPRRPLLLPRLLQMLNDDESTRQDVVRLLLDDPALAGNVLQRANSAYYRPSPMPIDSLDAAVRALGTDGLRGLVASAILQPVFRVPKGIFEDFAQITWEQAQRSARAAETGARSAGSADPFVAQLLGLLRPLARIVLFRLAMDIYSGHPDLSPHAEVFARSMRRHASSVARLIASSWALPDPSLLALDEQLHEQPPSSMSMLGRCLYYGELCGAAAMLEARGMLDRDDAETLLTTQGLPHDDARRMLQAALSADRE